MGTKQFTYLDQHGGVDHDAHDGDVIWLFYDWHPKTLYIPTPLLDDGAIEKGVGHVHAAFTEAKPEGVSETMSVFNEEMLMRARNRSRTRELWGIGQPFNAEAKERPYAVANQSKNVKDEDLERGCGEARVWAPQSQHR